MMKPFIYSVCCDIGTKITWFQNSFQLLTFVHIFSWFTSVQFDFSSLQIRESKLWVQVVLLCTSVQEYSVDTANQQVTADCQCDVCLFVCCWVAYWFPLSAYPPIERPRWGLRGPALRARGVSGRSSTMCTLYICYGVQVYSTLLVQAEIAFGIPGAVSAAHQPKIG